MPTSDGRAYEVNNTTRTFHDNNSKEPKDFCVPHQGDTLGYSDDYDILVAQGLYPCATCKPKKLHTSGKKVIRDAPAEEE